VAHSTKARECVDGLAARAADLRAR
jgi:hypothetical protein